MTTEHLARVKALAELEMPCPDVLLHHGPQFHAHMEGYAPYWHRHCPCEPRCRPCPWLYRREAEEKR